MVRSIDDMSLSELQAYHKEVEAAIKGYEKKKRTEAMAALRATAKEHGFVLEELIGGKPATKAMHEVLRRLGHPMVNKRADWRIQRQFFISKVPICTAVMLNPIHTRRELDADRSRPGWFPSHPGDSHCNHPRSGPIPTPNFAPRPSQVGRRRWR